MSRTGFPSSPDAIPSRPGQTDSYSTSLGRPSPDDPDQSGARLPVDCESCGKPRFQPKNQIPCCLLFGTCSPQSPATQPRQPIRTTNVTRYLGSVCELLHTASPYSK